MPEDRKITDYYEMNEKVSPIASGTGARALDLITIGRSSVDLYGQQIGGRLEDMLSFAKYLGGSPLNIAVGTARLGLRSALVTRVGDDHMGRFIREELAREGVSLEGVQVDPARLTALAVLGVKSEDQFPLLFYRENCADIALNASDIDPAFIASAAALLISGTHLSQPAPREACLKAVSAARTSGARVTLDIDYRPVLWGLAAQDNGEDRFVASSQVTATLQAIATDCDLIVGTEDEFRILGGSEELGKAIANVRAITAATLVCKTGADGCVIHDESLDSGFAHVPGFPIEVFNVLGAGDAFMSGFLRGWLRGESLLESGRMGNAAGALVVSRHGCSPASPSWDELNYFLRNGSSERALRQDGKLEQLHWATTRHRPIDELMVMAFDHRSQFEAIAAQAGAEHDQIKAFKALAFEAFERVAANDPRFGILADGRFGRTVLEKAADRPYWVGRPIELPSSSPVEFESSADVCAELNEWPRNHVVKCLVFGAPDADAGDVARQERQLARLFDACRKTRHELLLEIVITVKDDRASQTLTQMMQRYYDMGIYPDWWKLEPGFSNGHWEAVSQVITRNDPYCRGVLLLGLSMPIDELAVKFRDAAGHTLVKGFAIGRSIFGDAAEKWFVGAFDDAAAIADMEARLRQTCKAWQSARTAALEGTKRQA